jgi:outer membrane murein-binding lipoprotein Lpp
MPDDNTATSSVAVADEKPDSLDAYIETQRDEWLKSGTPQPKDEAEPAPAKKELSEPQQAEPIAPATDTGEKTQGSKSRVERRKGELNADIQELLAQRAALRADVEAETQKKAAKPAEPASAPQQPQTERAADGEPIPPDPEKWTGTWEGLEKAKIQYLKDFTIWQLQGPDRKRQARLAAEREQTNRATFERWVERREAATEADPEFRDANEIIGRFFTQQGVAPLIIESEVGPEVVMHFYKLPKDEQISVSNLSPAALAREIVRVEAQLSKRTEPTPQTPQLKRTSAAAKPPTELSGKGPLNTGDEAERALAEGRTGDYIQIMNARAVRKK